MSNQTLEEVLKINTDFVGQKDKKLSEVYADGNALRKKIADDKMLTEDDTFSEMSVAKIKRMVDIQMPDASNPTKDLSLDAVILYNDTLNWILGRRKADLEGGLARGEEICSAVAESCNAVIAVADIGVTIYDNYNNYKGIKDALTKLEKLSYDMNAEAAAAKTTPNTPPSNPTAFDDFKNKKENQKWFQIKGTGAQIEGTCSIGNCSPVTCEGTETVVVNGLINKLKDVKINVPELVGNFFALAGPATAMAKSIQTALINPDIREFNRAADCTSTIPIIKESSLACMGNGQYLDKNNQLQEYAVED